jgi:hypothetical protein
MTYQRIIGGIVVGTVLGLLSQQAAAEEKAKNTMAAATSEKMTARASRDMREGKAFTAADAEFLQRPLASQLVTVNPSSVSHKFISGIMRVTFLREKYICSSLTMKFG